MCLISIFFVRLSNLTKSLNPEHETNHPMKVVTGDIRNEKTVRDIMVGVDVVIHCAALVDVNMYPDEEGMKQTNVEGKWKNPILHILSNREREGGRKEKKKEKEGKKAVNQVVIFAQQSKIYF